MHSIFYISSLNLSNTNNNNSELSCISYIEKCFYNILINSLANILAFGCDFVALLNNT